MLEKHKSLAFLCGDIYSGISGAVLPVFRTDIIYVGPFSPNQILLNVGFPFVLSEDDLLVLPQSFYCITLFGSLFCYLLELTLTYVLIPVSNNL